MKTSSMEYAAVHVVGHLGGGDDEIQRQVRVCPELRRLPGGPGEFSPGSSHQPPPVDLLHLLPDLEEPGPARDPVGLEGRGDRQTDGFVGAALVGHHQIRGQRVQPPFHALHGGVEGLEVNGQILLFLIHPNASFSWIRKRGLAAPFCRLFYFAKTFLSCTKSGRPSTLACLVSPWIRGRQ